MQKISNYMKAITGDLRVSVQKKFTGNTFVVFIHPHKEPL